MHKLLPFASLAALIVGVFTVMTVAGAFDDDTQTATEGVSALCVEGFEDCDDMIVGNDGGDSDDAEPPTGSRDDLTETCLAGTADCDDLAGDDADPLTPADDPQTEGEALAIEASFAALEAMGGPPSNEVDVSGADPIDWPNGCLGVETPGVSCIQVITPGYIVFLSGVSGDYEFHTDTNGNAVFVPHD